MHVEWGLRAARPACRDTPSAPPMPGWLQSLHMLRPAYLHGTAGDAELGVDLLEHPEQVALVGLVLDAPAALPLLAPPSRRPAALRAPGRGAAAARAAPDRRPGRRRRRSRALLLPLLLALARGSHQLLPCCFWLCLTLRQLAASGLHSRRSGRGLLLQRGATGGRSQQLLESSKAAPAACAVAEQGGCPCEPASLPQLEAHSRQQEAGAGIMEAGQPIRESTKQKKRTAAKLQALPHCTWPSLANPSPTATRHLTCPMPSTPRSAPATADLILAAGVLGDWGAAAPPRLPPRPLRVEGPGASSPAASSSCCSSTAGSSGVGACAGERLASLHHGMHQPAVGSAPSQHVFCASHCG